MIELLLTPGHRLTLELRDHGDVEARAEWVDGDRVGIALFQRLPVLPSSLVGTAADLVYATPRGLHRAPAAVLAARRGGVLELTVYAAPEVDQRRDHVRVAVRVPSTVRPADGHRPPLHTFTIDVSGAGVLVAGAGPVHAGDLVEVSLRLPDEEGPLVVAPAPVVRVDPGGRTAIAFDDLAGRERERLVRFVFERQRLERRAARERRS